MYANSGAVTRRVTSPDSALASDVFDKFCNAVTFRSIMSLYRQLCDLLRLKPTYFPLFYPKLKAKLRSWKAQALWSKFDKRAAHRCYNRGKPCSNTRVLIIGCGPCGLRSAIEAQLLGAKVVVVEKRDRFTRNNVLHLWPFVIHDLRALGAKKFFGKFCAGSIDHISIRQLQCILIKVALLLGVEIHESVTFDSLVPPPEDQSIKIGWRAKVSPADHPVSQYEFDALISADGKRNTLEGFKRKEFRGRLAIAITANFVNRRTEAEARVEEISGVAFIFNQKFFRELNCATGIDLENIVYYKDETHYFVMTAKKQSLLNKGVIIKDYPDTLRLLSPENVNKEALMDYAREAADFSTNYQLPHLDFAVNHYGQPDVAMFDFTSMFAAENASRVAERRGHKLLMQIVGDSLLEPFWPTGSGCARGWLSSFDACWAINSWSSGRMTPLEVIAERESIYRLLAQTTPENLNKDYNAYTVEPQTRYPNLNTRACLDFQVRSLFDTDNPAAAELERPVKPPIEEGTRKRTKRPDSFIHPDTLLTWLKKQTALYDVTITDVTTSFQDGLALCAIIHRYRPDLIDFASLDPANVAGNNQLAFDILEELGVPPVTTGYEIAQCEVPDKLAMLSYLSQVHELFRGEIPCVKQPKREHVESDEDVLGACAKSASASLKRAAAPSVQRTPVPSKIPVRLSTSGTKRRSTEGSSKAGGDRYKSAESSLARKARKRRSTDRSQQNTADRNAKTGNGRGGGGADSSDSLTNKVRDLEAKLSGNCAADKKPKDLIRAIGKLEKTDWQLSALEKKIEENRNPYGAKGAHDNKVPKWNRDAFTDKLEAMNRRVHGLPLEVRNEKVENLERGMKQLERKLKEGSVLDTGNRGSNKVSAMAQQLAKKTPPAAKVSVEENTSFRPKPVLNLPQQGGSEVCHFCKKRVYLMERMSAEGKFFHRGCFRCEYCATILRLSGYGFVRDELLGGMFLCMPHLSLTYYMRKKLLASRGEQVDGQSGQENASVESKEMEQDVDNEKPENFEVIKSPLVQAAVKATEDFRRGGTPERVEFENSITAETTEDADEPSEIDEDEWTDHNFGNSINSASDDEASSLDDSSSELDEEDDDDEEEEEQEQAGQGGESNENIMELDRLLTADETRRLAESWQKRYSTEPDATTDSTPSPQVNHGEDEAGVCINVPAFPCEKKEASDSSTDTEIGSEELEMEGGDYEEQSDYENGEEEQDECGEEEEDEDEEEYDDEEDEDEDELHDSATEIETDSEFDQNSSVEVHVAPQSIPTIIVNELEADQIKKSTDFIASADVDELPVVAIPIEQPPKVDPSDPKPEFVDQYVSLEPARPAVQRTLSNEAAGSSTAPGRSGVLAYLRRHELLEKSPSASDLAANASKTSLELKKKYLLDYPGSVGSLAHKSASSTSLDDKFKSFVDTISEAQKKLNPAPQPSVPMQVFLQNTGNIFQPQAPRSVPNQLVLKETPREQVSSNEMETPFDDKDAFTPTNTHQPPPASVMEDAIQAFPSPVTTPVAPGGFDEDAASDSDSVKSKDGSEDSGDKAALFDDDSDLEPSNDTESSSVPFETRNEHVTLPMTATVPEEEATGLTAVKEEEHADYSDGEHKHQGAASQPHLAVQEDSDLSPVSETGRGVTSPSSPVLVRATSRESVDSGKFPVTETEFSDWNDNSLGGDLEAELDIDSEQQVMNKPAKNLDKEVNPLQTNGGVNLDDIEFADNSEERALDSKVHSPDAKASPAVSTPNQSTEESPEYANQAFIRQRDSIAVYREKHPPLHTPVKEDAVNGRDLHRRVLEKKYESSPNLVRKKDALSQERERQGDLVREMVLSRIQRSPEKTKERRSSYGSYSSITSPASSRASRSDSEPRITPTPDSFKETLLASQTSLRPVAEVHPAEFITPPSGPAVTGAVRENGTAGETVKRELFTSARPPAELPEVTAEQRIIPIKSSEQQLTSVGMKSNSEAQAKDDLGPSPADYIDSLREKLRRKPSDGELLPPRTRSFSEPHVEPEASLWNIPIQSKPMDNAAVKGVGQQYMGGTTAPKPINPPSSNPPSNLQSSKSVPQIPQPTPAIARSEVIGSMFLQQQESLRNSPSSAPSPTSPPTSSPISPRSEGSSRSASYLWAGLSPGDSQVKLDEAPTRSPSSQNSSSTPPPSSSKKPKDRERRRSLIQAITGLFSSKKEETKEPQQQPEVKAESKSEASGTTKKQKEPKSSFLGKLSPRKEKQKEKPADSSLQETDRVRSASTPVSPVHDTQQSVKPRTSSMKPTSSGSSSEATPSSAAAYPGQYNADSAAMSPSSPWLSLSLTGGSTRRQSKQAKQAARQNELKRLRMAQSIQRQLEEIEVKQKDLEEQGVKLEKALRGEDGGASGRDESTLMQEWFQLVHEKNALSRYEQELMVRARELELEDRHARLQQELKDRMSVDEKTKSPADLDKEAAILSDMLEIVEQKEQLRRLLEEDRQRYREEDKEMEAQMNCQGLRLRQRKESQV